MITRIAVPLALVLAIGCAEKLTGPAAQSAAREYQSTTVAADSTPLFFLNGKETPADSLRVFPTDRIESVEVIKGPTAVQRYGARAQYGVILVISK